METPPTSAAPPPLQTRRLRRRTAEGQIAGVCAGIADYLAVDVTLVRIVAIILAVTGPGVPAYLVAWVAMPQAAPGEPRQSDAPMDGRIPRRDRVPQLVGIGLLLIATTVMWDSWDWPGSRFFFPLALIAIGVALLLRQPTDPGGDGPPTGGSAIEPTTPWAPAPPPPSTPIAPSGEADDTTALTRPPLPPATPDAPPADDAPRRRRSAVTPVTLGAVLVWGGLAVLFGTSIVTGLAVATGIIAAGSVVGAFTGGAKALAFPGVLLALGLVGTTAVDVPIEGGVGERRWEVDEAADVDGPFRLAAGEATLDLRDLRAGAERTVEIEATVAFGNLRVQLPEDVPVRLTADVEAGNVALFGEDVEDGVDVDVTYEQAGQRSAGTIVLDLAVGLGQVEVLR